MPDLLPGTKDTVVKKKKKSAYNPGREGEINKQLLLILSSTILCYYYVVIIKLQLWSDKAPR